MIELGEKFTWDGSELLVTHIHEEPHTGLLGVSYRGFGFTLPVTFAVALRDLSKERVENDRLREALKYYANAYNYDPLWHGGATESEVQAERGNLARKALATPKPESEDDNGS